ncbi:cryptochrome/photolyase family protein [Paenibacillus monticola]|uniref:Deoxyribodipyrimidine photo-lyase n=1 Tax=Paenibacillus monticola TaxID=2666075 RepID=A0A7X2L030_9BACL|nr:deoxyribodipyrimidine photo-lyase [Paenibacillus monticola]MRN52327.1 deoxyribodipyrimidine photo-lyase [Paenibacillus monticola]
MILFIHRKDLRIHNLPALDAIRSAQCSSLHVLILDPFLLRNERNLEHSGVNFLQHVARLQKQYSRLGKQLHVLYGEPAVVVNQLLLKYPIKEILYHADYTPYALKRDLEIHKLADSLKVKLTSYDEATLVDLQDFVDWSGRTEPYKVFTPFYRRWRTYVTERFHPSYSATLEELETVELTPGLLDSFLPPEEINKQLEDMRNSLEADDEYGVLMHTLDHFLSEQLNGYSISRDQYAKEGTSRISHHLNAGALSVRTIYEQLMSMDGDTETWLRQLAWRDFYIYQARLDPNFFRYENVFDQSELSTEHFQVWAEGCTGVPIIDAAMRQLNETGWMPNRLRMITAMFLTKNLGCPFMYGERYFRLKLSDYDNILNRGGWLWSSSLGFDASPYFRVMNPVTQSQTHDPDGTYLRRWMPELAHLSNKEIHLARPEAIVDLKSSRALAIEIYGRILKTKNMV